MTRSVLLALLALVLAADTAGAATVRVVRSVVDDRIDIEVTDTATFRAEPGERNRVVVDEVTPLVVRFRDPGAVMTAGRGCERRARHVAVCDLRTTADYHDVAGYLRDRRDRWVSRSLPASVQGGAGADRLRDGPGLGTLEGGAGPDRLRGGGELDDLGGGAGNDVLMGGPGPDHLVDGRGHDVVRGGPGKDSVYSTDRKGPPGPDRFAGGKGRDIIDYTLRSNGVRVALGRGGGRPGEGDELRGFEHLVGTSFADRLVGTRGPNVIDSGEGDDVVFARGGDDRIVTQSFGRQDDVHCGPGRDRADEALLRPDCEIARQLFYPVVAQPLAVSEDTVTLGVRCIDTEFPVPRRITLRTPPPGVGAWARPPYRRVLARGEIPLGREQDRCDVTLRLTRAGRRMARPLPVQVRSSAATWSFILRAP